MELSSSQAVSQILERASAGDREALSKLVPIVYTELRRLARGLVRKERKGITLQATDLVHEVYMRLLRDQHVRWQNRAHFLAIAARAMRQILVERARARAAAKRGGGLNQTTLNELVVGHWDRPLDLLALDEALQALAALDPRHAELVELRFFGGLTIEETAEAMGISPATVKRWWELSKAFLHREMSA
jgi:RNA polymerase sigma factor (TIGR02999 family)